MAIQGDTKALQAMRRRLASIKSPEFRKRVLSVLGQEALYRSLQCFEKSRDPYEVRWAPLKLRSGRPLLDKGILRNSLNVRVLSAQSFEVATDVRYAKLHQYGGTITPKNARVLSWSSGGRRFFAKSVTIPARPYLPDGRGMPRSWARGFRVVASDFIRASAMRGAR